MTSQNQTRITEAEDDLARKTLRLTIKSERIAQALEDLAGYVRNSAADIDRVGETNSLIDQYARVASDIQHSVLWGLSNLGLDHLTERAAEADRAASVLKSLKD